MKISKKEYQNIIGNDISAVEHYIPDGLSKNHIKEVLTNSINIYYPNEQKESTYHSDSTEQKALHIADVSQLRELLWEFVNTKEFDTEFQTDEEQIEYYIKEIYPQ